MTSTSNPPRIIIPWYQSPFYLFSVQYNDTTGVYEYLKHGQVMYMTSREYFYTVGFYVLLAICVVLMLYILLLKYLRSRRPHATISSIELAGVTSSSVPPTITSHNITQGASRRGQQQKSEGGGGSYRTIPSPPTDTSSRGANNLIPYTPDSVNTESLLNEIGRQRVRFARALDFEQAQPPPHHQQTKTPYVSRNPQGPQTNGQGQQKKEQSTPPT